MRCPNPCGRSVRHTSGSCWDILTLVCWSTSSHVLTACILVDHWVHESHLFHFGPACEPISSVACFCVVFHVLGPHACANGIVPCVSLFNVASKKMYRFVSDRCPIPQTSPTKHCFVWLAIFDLSKRYTSQSKLSKAFHTYFVTSHRKASTTVGTVV